MREAARTTPVTRAPGGPCDSRRSRVATASAGPATFTSTEPSLRLRTEPRSPSAAPVQRTHIRKPTPCTFPWILKPACSSITAPSLAHAEFGEDTIQHVLRGDHTEQLLERGLRRAEVRGGHLRAHAVAQRTRERA